MYQWLREERPVTRMITKAGDPAWLVTRYDDVRAVLADPRVSADIDNPGLPYMMPGTKEPTKAMGLSFLRMDRPHHTLYRRLLSKNFMVKRVEAMRAAIQKQVDDTIDAMLASPDRPVDLVQALALPLPSTVLSWILGVREKDRNRGALQALVVHQRRVRASRHVVRSGHRAYHCQPGPLCLAADAVHEVARVCAGETDQGLRR